MRKLNGHTLWRVGRALVTIFLFTLGHALAQDPPKPGVVDPKLEAFDGDVVGYEGIAIDMKTASVAYDELDYQIATWEENIKGVRALIAQRQTQGGPDAASKISELNQELAGYQAHLNELLLRKKLRDSGGECEAKIKGWQDLIAALRHNLATEESYAAAAPANDTRAYFQNAVDLDHTLIADAISQISVIKEACDEAKDQAVMANILGALEKANKVAKQSAAEAKAIAKGGHFSDIPAISKKLAIVLEVARFNQKMGYGELGLEQQQWAEETVKGFSEKAVKACMDDSFDAAAAASVQFQMNKAGIDGDLSPCMNRLIESAGGKIDPNTYYAFRHCGTSATGEWQVREVSKFLKVAGAGNVAGTPGVSGTAQVNDDGSGTVSLSGMFYPNDHVTYPFKIVIDGTLLISKRNLISWQSLVTGRWRNMELHLTIEPHTATNIFHRTVNVPAVTLDEDEDNVVIINNNKPCDPSKSVWDYP